MIHEDTKETEAGGADLEQVKAFLSGFDLVDEWSIVGDTLDIYAKDRVSESNKATFDRFHREIIKHTGLTPKAEDDSPTTWSLAISALIEKPAKDQG